MKTESLVIRISLARSHGKALYRQIYERVRGSVLAGQIAAGARLPSARSLSEQLGVARGTVELAYQLLASEGYTVSRGPGGTVVAALPARALPRSPRRSSSIVLARRVATARGAIVQPACFQMGLPAIDRFPRKLWARLTARAARDMSRGNLILQNPAGSLRLRQAIAAYLHIGRGVECTADRIFITSGYQGALGLIAQTLMAPNDKVWLEDPAYFRALDALKFARVTVIPVPVDAEGIDVQAGMKKSPRAKFALVTPCHQYPTGVALTIPRRLALLDWAVASNAWIIEDDYDSEFRYQGKPLPALKSIDSSDRVLYIGTFSKVLYPGLRMGYLVVPNALIDKFTQGCALLHPAAATLEQRVVREFLEQGHFGRHLSRMRRLYRERRAALAVALEETCGDVLRCELRVGGMHLLAYLRDRTSDKKVVMKAVARGLAPVPLSSSAIEAPIQPGLLLGFANISAEAAGKAARGLRQCF